MHVAVSTVVERDQRRKNHLVVCGFCTMEEHAIKFMLLDTHGYVREYSRKARVAIITPVYTNPRAEKLYANRTAVQ